MRIAVCVKYVPDPVDELEFADGRIVRENEGSLAEIDENALEAARRIGGDDAEIIAVAMGPTLASVAVRRALAMGATRGILVSDDVLAGSDVFGTADVLARVVRLLGKETGGAIDAVVTGIASPDAGSSLLPAVLAAKLEWPALTMAREVACDGTTIGIARDIDGVNERLRSPLPVVLSVTDEANSPANPGMKSLLAARKATIDTMTASDLGIDAQSAPRVQVKGTQHKPPREPGTIIVDTGEAGAALAEYITGVMGR